VLSLDTKYILQKNHFLFDLDGTLIDSAPSHERAYKLALSTHRSGDEDKFSYDHWRGVATTEVFTQLGYPSHVVPGLVTEKQKNYRQLLAKGEVDLFAGARELLLLLTELKKHVYLVTGSSRLSVDTILNNLGIRPIFRGVVTCDDVQRSKPDPEPFLKIVDGFNLQKQEAIVIEDASAGVLSARAAGLDVVLVNADPFENTICYESIHKLYQQMHQERSNAL
jgi:beta-phosphoglucomutase